MDVLNPELMWIGQRCYRVNVPDDNRINEERTKAAYEEDEEEFCGFDVDDDEDFYEIETIDNGRKFQLKVHVPQMFHSQVIGAKGNTRRRLEQETSTQILVPKIGSKDTNVVIKGKHKKDLISVKNRLDLIMIAGRAKQQFTHFLSISFSTDEIRSNFARFKDELINDSEIFGLNESLFQKPEKLHLTIAMLVLLDNQDRAIAAEYLQDCKEMIIDPILQGGPLKVKLSGLNYMNDDPSAVDVLYAKVNSEQLQEIANAIAEYFSSRGFIELKHDNVKLHVTLMNSLFADNDDAIEKDENQDRREGKLAQRKTFDASKILQKYKDFYFGSFDVKEICLSQRYSKATNGYYESTGVIKMI
jgi:activating signal cointegrator complex subunit 1